MAQDLGASKIILKEMPRLEKVLILQNNAQFSGFMPRLGSAHKLTLV